MSSQILQPTRALKVIPGSGSDIPFPEAMYSGVIASFTENVITVDGADFNALGVAAGDIIYMPGANMNVTVIDVLSPDMLKINWYPNANYSFTIYKGGLNRGCVLYVGSDGNPQLTLTTASGSMVQFQMSGSGFIPLQVVSILEATDTSNIVAFW